MGELKCKKCPAYGNGCGIELTEKTLNLINRRDAEIERLEIELKAMRGAANSYKLHYEKTEFLLKEAWESIEQKDRRTEIIKTEAYKEFAERLKALFSQYADYDALCIYEVKDRIDIALEEAEAALRKEDEGK